MRQFLMSSARALDAIHLEANKEVSLLRICRTSAEIELSWRERLIFSELRDQMQQSDHANTSQEKNITHEYPTVLVTPSAPASGCLPHLVSDVYRLKATAPTRWAWTNMCK